MKTFNTIRIILVLLLGVFMCSCEQRTSARVTKVNDVHFDDIMHFSYKGHDYIKFYRYDYQNSTAGVVHNPDCNCNKK